jgi:hypothetical protein
VPAGLLMKTPVKFPVAGSTTKTFSIRAPLTLPNGGKQALRRRRSSGCEKKKQSRDDTEHILLQAGGCLCESTLSRESRKASGRLGSGVAAYRETHAAGDRVNPAYSFALFIPRCLNPQQNLAFFAPAPRTDSDLRLARRV